MMEIRWHGRGGQGAKTASAILGSALLEAGKWVQAFPEYGPERSGAPVRAYNRYDDREVRLRCGVTRPDAVVVLDPTLLAEVDVVAGVPREGFLIVNTEAEESTVRESLAFDGAVLCVPGDRLAREAGTGHANVVLLGALARAQGEPSLEGLRAALRAALGGKLSTDALETTCAGLEAGYEAAGSPPTSGAPGRSPDLPAGSRRRRSTRPPPSFRDLEPGGTVFPGRVRRPQTGGWRDGRRPEAEVGRCVNCLLCWLYCPDSAVRLDGSVFLGFDYDLCKGCDLCVEVCPTGAIAMVPEPVAFQRVAPRTG